MTDFHNFQNFKNLQPQYGTYAYNPYVCANAPVSQVVMPQGQVQMPNTIVQPPEVQSVQIPPQYNQGVNYNQVTPYLNTGSPVFQPTITTKSGQIITMAAPDSSQPFNPQESQLVYSGPVKTINPQITPVEQTDNEINKQMNKYFKDKIKFNEEFKEALNKTTGINNGKTPWYKSLLKFVIFATATTLAYKFRHKIPLIKNFCK